MCRNRFANSRRPTPSMGSASFSTSGAPLRETCFLGISFAPLRLCERPFQPPADREKPTAFFQTLLMKVAAHFARFESCRTSPCAQPIFDNSTLPFSRDPKGEREKPALPVRAATAVMPIVYARRPTTLAEGAKRITWRPRRPRHSRRPRRRKTIQCAKDAKQMTWRRWRPWRPSGISRCITG
jgi:hypothetical protein